jgi:hypothetical protein
VIANSLSGLAVAATSKSSTLPTAEIFKWGLASDGAPALKVEHDEPGGLALLVTAPSEVSARVFGGLLVESTGGTGVRVDATGTGVSVEATEIALAATSKSPTSPTAEIFKWGLASDGAPALKVEHDEPGGLAIHAVANNDVAVQVDGGLTVNGAFRATGAAALFPTTAVVNTSPSGTALHAEATAAGAVAIRSEGMLVAAGGGSQPSLYAEADTGPAISAGKSDGAGPAVDITLGAFTDEAALVVTANGDTANQIGVDVVVDRGTYTDPPASVGVRSKAVNQLHLVPHAPPPGTRTTPAQPGMLTVDSDNQLWFCVNPGTPGFWRKLAGPSTAGSLHLLNAPVRVYDSRATDPPFTATPKGKLQDGAVRTVLIDTATMVGPVLGLLMNVTVVNTSAGGFLSVYRSGIAWPGTSSMNWFQPNTVLANMVVTRTASTAQVGFDVKVAPGAETDFIVDVVGYLV